MAIQIDDVANRESFPVQNHTHYESADGQHVWALTGIVKLHDAPHGTGRDWAHEDLEFSVTVPGIPSGKVLKLKHWAPHLALNAIYNDGAANFAGWAIDGFRLTNQTVYGQVGISTVLAVRDVDGWLPRVSYVIHLVGVFADAEKII